MVDVIAAVDSVTGAFGPLVQARLEADMQTAIDTGVTTAVTNMPGIAAAVTDAIAPLTTLTALKTANVVPSAAVNAITGWYHIDGYGAVGNGTTIDRPAIQAAITAANAAYVASGTMQRVYVPAKTFAVDAVNYLKDDGTTVNGSVSLMLLDGVELFGPGTIKVRNGAYGTGAFYAVIRSKSGGLSNAKITGITVDGNKANQTASIQCSNIVLECLTNVEVNGTTQNNANGNGIMLRGTTSTYATDLRIKNNRVAAATAIGIQASQFDGLDIDNNDVRFTTDNAIDIYGEDGDTSPHGLNFRITNNRTVGGLVGVFLETVAQGVVTGNLCTSATDAGIHVNRINGQPNAILITANTIIGSPRGAYFTGDTGGVVFRGNLIKGASVAGVQLGGGGGNCSYIYVLDNTIDTATVNATPLVLANTSGGVVSFCRIRGTVTSNTNRTWDFIVQPGTTSTSNTASAANAA